MVQDAERFTEALPDMLRRNALGLAWGLKPARAAGFLPGLAFVLRELARPSGGLPDPRRALARPDGLCGVASDMSPETLVEAHARGLYPFAHVGPFKWWSPSERAVLFFEEFHIQKVVRRLMRNKGFTVTFDTAFAAVLRACAAPREGKPPLTWIRPELMRAYLALHRLGHAHSVEVWNAAGELAGGGYGVAAGGVYTVESNFTREAHASKIGMTVLNWHLQRWGFGLSDNKRQTPTSKDQGYRDIPRDAFLALLERHRAAPRPLGPWRVEAEVKEIAAWEPAAGVEPREASEVAPAA
jgi:leucyl/phenylalanyl-tRNA--protein transferase